MEEDEEEEEKDEEEEEHEEEEEEEKKTSHLTRNTDQLFNNCKEKGVFGGYGPCSGFCSIAIVTVLGLY